MALWRAYAGSHDYGSVEAETEAEALSAAKAQESAVDRVELAKARSSILDKANTISTHRVVFYNVYREPDGTYWFGHKNSTKQQCLDARRSKNCIGMAKAIETERD